MALEHMHPVLSWTHAPCPRLAKDTGQQTLLDEVEGIHRLPLFHNHLALGGPGGAQEDCQADELLPAQVSKGGHPLEHPQQALQLVKLQASHLCIMQQLRQGWGSSLNMGPLGPSPPQSCYMLPIKLCNAALVSLCLNISQRNV